MTTRIGGCLCGAIRYEISAPPLIQFACHCRACQHATGGSPTLGLIVPAAALKVTKGAPREYASKGESGGEVGRQFCETCGSPLFSRLGGNPDVAVVKVGSLDDPSDFQVQVDMWRGAAQPWQIAHQGAAQFEANPG